MDSLAEPSVDSGAPETQLTEIRRYWLCVDCLSEFPTEGELAVHRLVCKAAKGAADMEWSDELDQMLKDGWADGLSVQAVAEAVGAKSGQVVYYRRRRLMDLGQWPAELDAQREESIARGVSAARFEAQGGEAGSRSGAAGDAVRTHAVADQADGDHEASPDEVLGQDGGDLPIYLKGAGDTGGPAPVEGAPAAGADGQPKESARGTMKFDQAEFIECWALGMPVQAVASTFGLGDAADVWVQIRSIRAAGEWPEDTDKRRSAAVALSLHGRQRAPTTRPPEPTRAMPRGPAPAPAVDPLARARKPATRYLYWEAELVTQEVIRLFGAVGIFAAVEQGSRFSVVVVVSAAEGVEGEGVS